MQLARTGENPLYVRYGRKIEYFAHLVNIGLYEKRLEFKRFGKKLAARVHDVIYAVYAFKFFYQGGVGGFVKTRRHAAANYNPVVGLQQLFQLAHKLVYIRPADGGARAVYVRFVIAFDFYVYSALSADFYKVVV